MKSTEARKEPSEVVMSTSTVGLPRESMISRACTAVMVDMQRGVAAAREARRVSGVIMVKGNKEVCSQSQLCKRLSIMGFARVPHATRFLVLGEARSGDT